MSFGGIISLTKCYIVTLKVKADMIQQTLLEKQERNHSQNLTPGTYAEKRSCGRPARTFIEQLAKDSLLSEQLQTEIEDL